MIKQIKDTARAGVTLVELLVVILIIAILAVTMLPMFEKYVTKAKYAAEPIPMVGHVKTQVDLYMYEHSKIPGTNGWAYTWLDDDSKGWDPVMYALVSQKPTNADFKAPSSVSADHIGTLLEINTSDFGSMRLKPTHMYYACIQNGGYDKANNTTTGYGYAIGVFGNGDNLKKNTGYAVAEIFYPNVVINNAGETGYRLVTTWENYAGTGGSTATGDNGQVAFALQADDSSGICPLPDTSTAKLESFSTFAAVSASYSQWAKGIKCGKWMEVEFPTFSASPQ